MKDSSEILSIQPIAFLKAIKDVRVMNRFHCPT